ncbi:MAG: D-alanyl-D-alanine carboxypeptidase [Clostridia bacterium]|nr:D-alanyl-D-alanine carboxypeptidase [Clostridia bacterium]
MQQDPMKRPQQQSRIPQQQSPQKRTQTPPPQYRSAEPYTVAPRQGTQRVPYPQAEARRRQLLRRKRRRRRILLLITVCILCLLLIAGFITAAVFAIRYALSDKTDPTHDNPVPGISDAVADTTAAPIPAETEPPLPPYQAPNKIDGNILTPIWSDTVVSLSDTVSCANAILINAQTGQVVAEKNGAQIIYPASMTKLMTVLVAYEMLPDLDATFRMTQDIIDPLYLDGLSLAGFSGGEEITIRDLLHGSALPSGAEASYALAVAACGSEEAFVEKMNERALHLGMYSTHFENCTGAHHPDHVSSLGDIAVLIAFMMQNEDLAAILGTYQYTTTPTAKHPEGLLLTSTVFSRMEGSESGVCTVIGGKTGYTVQGGQCLATYAVTRTGDTGFVCVTAGGETKWRPVYDSIYLYQHYTGTVLPTTPPAPITPKE